MPVSDYDRWHGGKPGSAAKARRALKKTYGAEKGERVFWALTNDRRKAGKGEGMRGVLRGKARRK